MQVIQGKYAGFCSGVRRAVEKVLDEAKAGKKICLLGPLVHNEEVRANLKRHNVKEVLSPDEAAGGDLLVIRTHGVAPSVLESARQKDIAILDATCPKVRRVQELAASLREQGINIVMYGDRHHPEAEGVAGWAGGRITFVSSPEELRELAVEEPVALIAQTTGNRAVFEQIKEAFLIRAPGGKVYDTLCPETQLRQAEVPELAQNVDALVVVGGADSANTRELVELCRAYKPTCRVVNAGELRKSFFNGCRVVGVTAGASTPHWTIKEVVERMENEKFEAENEEQNEEQTEEQFNYEEKVRTFQAGEQVSGQVVRVTPDEAFIDIGYKTEALLPRSEIYLREGESLPERLNTGDVIEVTILAIDDQEGRALVSHRRLAREAAWRALEDSLKNNITCEGRVKQVVPAGMVVELPEGIEGFMPGSLVDRRYIPDFKPFMNEVIPFKIIEINRERQKVIVSRKKVLEDEALRQKEETLRSLQVGSIIPGVVRRLTDFGAFVDVGGIDGLVHISELSWERVGHPQDVLKVGDEISVKVLEVIPEKERISLSLRQVQPDPWTTAAETFRDGEIVTGKVTRLVNFGAFVELKPGLEGLVHISQMADYHVKHPSEVLKEGEEVEVKILEVRPSEKRISLSIKEARGSMPPQSAADKDHTDNGGNVTLGDVFGDLFNQENLADKTESEEGDRE